MSRRLLPPVNRHVLVSLPSVLWLSLEGRAATSTRQSASAITVYLSSAEAYTGIWLNAALEIAHASAVPMRWFDLRV